MDGRAVALILAVIGLVLGVGARLRAQRNGSQGARAQNGILLIPCAIIIGTLPWVLQLGETVKNVASVTSIVVSLAAVVLQVIQIGGSRRA